MLLPNLGGLKGKIFSGVVWNSIQTIVNRAFGFVIKLVLARLLFPEDFGLIGMAMVFIGFIRVFNDMGFGNALVQRSEKKLNTEHFYTAFWSGLVWATIVYIILSFIIAPFAAIFYNEDKLLSLIPILSLSVLLSPLVLVNRAQLLRGMDFKKLAIINNSSSIVAGIIAVTAAFFGAGVWALAIHSIGSVFISVPLFFNATKWKPKFIWNKICFKDLFGFGVYTTFSGLIGKISSQGDYLLIGKLLGKYELGLYSFAFVLTDSFRSQIKSTLNTVLFPVYSSIQDNRQKQFYLYSKNVFYNALIVTPIMVVLVSYSDVVTIVFGEKWAESVTIVQLIALAVIFDSVTVSISSLLQANSKVNIELYLLAGKVFLIFLPLIYFGVKFHGIVGAAFAVLIFKMVGTIFDLIILNKILSFSSSKILFEFLSGCLPSIIGICISYVCFYLIPSPLPRYAIFLKILLFLIFYSSSVYILYKNDIKKLIAK